MKMVGHQAPSDGFGNWIYMEFVFLQEKSIVLLFSKKVVIFISVIVDVVIRIEGEHFLSGFLSKSKSKLFQITKLPTSLTFLTSKTFPTSKNFSKVLKLWK